MFDFLTRLIASLVVVLALIVPMARPTTPYPVMPVPTLTGDKP